MRRNTRTTAFEADPSEGEAPQNAYPSEEGIERRRHPRVRFDAPSEQSETDPSTTDRRQGDRRQGDRRKSDRRSVDAMRAELQRAKTQHVQRRSLFDKIFNRSGRSSLKPSRILLLAVALISGGMAAFMATQREQPVTTPALAVAQTEVIREARTRILVAKQSIGIGQRLSPISVGWEEWPEGSVQDDYVTFLNEPEALDVLQGSVARFEFFPGEPIREQKLVRDANGYLSAILETGQRAVSVSVSAASASGGFISPNDHVDIILTRTSATSAQISETILYNVRVLAIDARLGETGTTGEPADPNNPRAEMFTNIAIATLELDPLEAEVIIGATMVGQLSLVLRSMTDFSEPDLAQQRGANQAIRLTSPFWTQNSTQAGLL